MSTTCGKAEALRDYAFDELPAIDRPEMERHIGACPDCAAELDQLRLTTAALRILPDREIPQRIAFVSDKVFQPSPVTRFLRSAWAGLASAGLMAAALIFTVVHQPAPRVRTIIQSASGTDVTQQVAKQIDEAVSRAVQQAHTQDAELTKAALAEAETRHQREHRVLMVEMEQSLEYIQKRLGTMTSLTSSMEAPQNRSGQ
jgi:anti-sigma factor RsiW